LGGKRDEVTLKVDPKGLVRGIYRSNIVISDPLAIDSPQVVEVNLYVGGMIQVPKDYGTIQAAINAAGDTCEVVVVADGVYRGDGNRDIDFLGKSIMVRSENGPENCIIDCEGTHRGFYFNRGEDHNSILEGFTVIDGFADWGGGIYCQQSSPTLNNCRVKGNEAGRGGGLYNNNSHPILTCCSFESNLADWGGGVYNDNSNPELDHCTFNENWADSQGGGILNENFSRPIVSDLTPNYVPHSIRELSTCFVVCCWS